MILLSCITLIFLPTLSLVSGGTHASGISSMSKLYFRLLILESDSQGFDLCHHQNHQAKLLLVPPFHWGIFRNQESVVCEFGVHVDLLYGESLYLIAEYLYLWKVFNLNVPFLALFVPFSVLDWWKCSPFWVHSSIFQVVQWNGWTFLTLRLRVWIYGIYKIKSYLL